MKRRSFLSHPKLGGKSRDGTGARLWNPPARREYNCPMPGWLMLSLPYLFL